MKKLLFLSVAVLLTACNGKFFSSSNGNDMNFLVQSPYDNEELNEMLTPDIYALAATRATNRMLDATSEIYEKSPVPKIYISKIKRASNALPDGLYYAKKATNGIIEGSRSFVVVNNLNDADYYLETEVIEVPVTSSETPIVQYKLVLNTSKNVKVGEWAESIRQLQNDDKSWW